MERGNVRRWVGGRRHEGDLAGPQAVCVQPQYVRIPFLRTFGVSHENVHMPQVSRFIAHLLSSVGCRSRTRVEHHPLTGVANSPARHAAASTPMSCLSEPSCNLRSLLNVCN